VAKVVLSVVIGTGISRPLSEGLVRVRLILAP
jgi:hypothetical protein